MDRNIVISIKTVLFTLLLIAVGYVIYRLGPIIAVLVIATFLAIALENTVRRLMKGTLFNRPLPRSLAVLITYSIVIFGIILIVTLGLPPVVAEGQKLLQNLSAILDQLKVANNLDVSLSTLVPQVTNVSGGVINVTISIFTNIATLFTTLVISIYLSLDWPNIKRHFINLMPEKYRDDIKDTIQDIESSVGHWLKGELTLMTIVGTMTLTGLVALDVKYALALGLIAGVLEAVPMIGPLIAAVVSTIIGFSIGTSKGLLVLLLTIVIQQVENNIIVPRVMGKVSGFSPLVILVALLVGTTLFGIVGAILAVPSTIMFAVVLKRVLNYSSRDHE